MFQQGAWLLRSWLSNRRGKSTGEGAEWSTCFSKSLITFGELLLWISLTFRSYTKYSQDCFIRYPNTSKLVEKTRLRLVFSTHSSVFGYLNDDTWWNTLPCVWYSTSNYPLVIKTLYHCCYHNLYNCYYYCCCYCAGIFSAGTSSTDIFCMFLPLLISSTALTSVNKFVSKMLKKNYWLALRSV